MKKTQAQLEATKRWKLKNKAKVADYQRMWRASNLERKHELERQWYERNPERAAYRSQRQAARSRHIEWKFTFQTWHEWWGDDFQYRGIDRDIGPYAPDNTYKGTAKDNSRDYRERQKEIEDEMKKATK